MNTAVRNVLVRKSIVVQAPQSHVFDVFTARLDLWWPRSHHIGTRETFTALMEPRAGGRWYERGDDGSECDWGRVLQWEPPKRLLLSWQLSADWKHDPQLDTEVEVVFTAEGDARTRVEIEHRKLENYGDKAEMMRQVFESPNAWSGMLEAMKQSAEAAMLSR
jgi:uncharacterized protein YndB with AHSA1/START domain